MDLHTPQIRRAGVFALIAIGLVAAVFVRAPRALTGGDFAQPLDHARMLLAGRDPLATPPANASSIPYPLTASTLLIGLAWAPAQLVSALVVICAALACWLMPMAQAPRAHWMGWLLLLAYLPLVLNLTLIQWAPPLLAGLAAGLLLERRGHPALAGLAWVPLLAKAQLVPILAVPLGLTLLLTGRRRSLAAALAGWAALLGISLLLRPGWPLVWWDQTRPYTGGYAALAVALPTLGLPLMLAGAGLAWLAWRRRDGELLLSALVCVMSLLTPQRAIYEAAALLVPLAYLLRDYRLVAVVVGLSWLLLPLAALGLSSELSIALSLYGPALAGLWLRAWGAGYLVRPSVAA